MKRAQSPIADEQQGRPRLRSQSSQRLSLIRFCNATQRRVDVIWINYEGARVRYKTLEPAEFCDVNTYVTHPWVFRDSITHDKLVVRYRDVFEPAPWYEQFIQDIVSRRLLPENVRPQRVSVYITIPVYSLKERAFQVIRQCLQRQRDAYKLDIPKSLQVELATTSVNSLLRN